MEEERNSVELNDLTINNIEVVISNDSDDEIEELVDDAVDYAVDVLKGVAIGDNKFLNDSNGSASHSSANRPLSSDKASKPYIRPQQPNTKGVNNEIEKNNNGVEIIKKRKINNKAKNLVDKCKSYISFYFGVDDFDELIEKFPMPTNSVVDFNELPSVFRWSSFGLWNLFFVIIAICLLNSEYKNNRTNSFISLDINAGECVEVPQTVTGQFLGDANGNWNTNSKFKYALSQYTVGLLGLTYTTDQWREKIMDIESEVVRLVAKASQRDFSWNIIAWSSYKTVNTRNGRLEFTFAASASAIFAKDYVAVGMGSAHGILNQDLASTNSCNQQMTVSYDVLSSTLTADLPIGDPVDSYLCFNGTAPPCQSVSPACKNIGITLQSLGYDTTSSKSTSITMTFSMIAVSTALSINFGMNSLENLQQVMGDNDRVTLLTKMNKFGFISQAILEATSSYYDAFYSPASIVYCTNWALVDTKYQNLASCFVRVGNTLMYPLVVSSGYTEGEGSMPNRCTKKAVDSKTEDAAKYYCNLMNFNIGFIYYPTDDLESNPTPAPTSYRPGFPTVAPTTPHPTKRPTKSPDYQPYIPYSPTVEPTTGAPTSIPTPSPPTPFPTFASPTKAPTRKPTSIPTAIPTRPTKAPSSARRNLQNIPQSVRSAIRNILSDKRVLQTSSTEPTMQPTSDDPPSSMAPPSMAPTSENAPLTASPSTDDYVPITYTLKWCPKYSAVNTNNASINYVPCTVNACSNQYVGITTCYYQSGNTTIGDTYLKLYSSNKFLVENDNDPYCSPYTGVSFIGFMTSGSGCKDYQIRQGCFQNTSCNSTTVVFIVDIPPSYQFDDDYVPPTFDDDTSSSSGGGIYDIDDFTAPPVPMDVVRTDDYNFASADDFRGKLTDDFVISAVVESVDNGQIFSFALDLAQELLNIPATNIENDPYCSTENAKSVPFQCSNGDVSLPMAAFDALAAILNTNSSNINNYMSYICSSAYDDDWHYVADNPGEGPFGPAGCSMIAIQLSGDQNRVINEYYFQPYNPKGVAFTNTIYQKNSFEAMYTPPTQLTQIYYKCVMSPGEAWFNSLGIAQANSVVYTSLFFSVLMYILVTYLNYVKKVNPKVRTIQRVAIEQSKEEAEDKLTLAVLREVMLNGSLGFTYDVKAACEREKGNIRESLHMNNDDDNSSDVSVNPLQHRVV